MGSYLGRALLAQVVEAKQRCASQQGAELREAHAVKLYALPSVEQDAKREAYFKAVKLSLSACGPAPVGKAGKAGK